MSRYNSHYSDWPAYVTVAERKLQAAKMVESLKKKGQNVNPVVIEGRTIAKTFWGKAWCKNLATYSDFVNRLPRGRTYVRNGSVIDLTISAGEITALVSGSSIYKVRISMVAVSSQRWQSIVKECAGKIDSLIELLQGKFSKAVMQIITHEKTGLFPHPKELTMHCSCFDHAGMCKHVAATLYGIGARLDEQPEKLFLLRTCDHMELIAKADTTNLAQATSKKGKNITSDLSSLFGIEIEDKNGSVASISNKKKL